MSARVIGQMKIHQRAWIDEYFSKVPDLIKRHGEKFAVRGGNPQALEEQESLPDAIFILEFPSWDQALASWRSAEFAPLIELRQTGFHLEAMLVDSAL